MTQEPKMDREELEGIANCAECRHAYVSWVLDTVAHADKSMSRKRIRELTWQAFKVHHVFEVMACGGPRLMMGAGDDQHVMGPRLCAHMQKPISFGGLA